MDIAQLIRLKLGGATYAELGQMLGISRQRVQQLLAPPTAVRRYVVEKYRGICSSCGLTVGESGHVHHNGPTDEEDWNDIDNLELLCRSCHRAAHLPEYTPVTLQAPVTPPIEIESKECLRCGHKWIPRKPGEPTRCASAKCKSPYWDKLPRRLRQVPA